MRAAKKTSKSPRAKCGPHCVQRLVRRLKRVAELMRTIGADMDYYGGWGEMGDHGREMLGAAKIARDWADKMAPPNDKRNHGAEDPNV